MRRLVVAMSRARLGLYVFARVSLFHNCFELIPAFQQLTARPLQLQLLPDERYPPQLMRAAVQTSLAMKDMTQMHQFVYDMYIRRAQETKQPEQKIQKTFKMPPVAESLDSAEIQKEVPIEFEVLAEGDSAVSQSVEEGKAEQPVSGEADNEPRDSEKRKLEGEQSDKDLTDETSPVPKKISKMETNLSQNETDSDIS